MKAIITAPARWTWNGLKRTGRVLLWTLFLPLGLWRSIRHGRKRRERELVETLTRVFPAKLEGGDR